MANIRIYLEEPLSKYLTEPPAQPEDAPGRYLSSSGLEMQWYEEAIKSIPESGWHNSLMGLAAKAKKAGINQDTFVADVQANTPGGVYPNRVWEIIRAYTRCSLDRPRYQALMPTVSIEKPAPMMLPDPVENQTEQFLKALFYPDETIVLAPGIYDANLKKERPDDLRREGKTRDEWIEIFRQTDPSAYFQNDIGIYVKVNPLEPGMGPTEKGLMLPFAKDENVTAFRWLLVESDVEKKEVQLGCLHAAGFPYATIVDSGARSLHALIRLDADNLEDYAQQANSVYKEFEKLMALDRGDKNPSRYSRLPGCIRSKSKRQTLLEVYDDVPSVQENNRQKWLSGCYTLAEYYRMDVPQEDTLLGNRFLCRKGSLLFVGPSGIGKSSASVQSDVLWSLGKEAFGIKPAFPLKILCVQAENDDGDMIEMTRGVIQGLRLDDNEIESVGKNTLYRNFKDLTGLAFLAWLENLIAAYQPDIVRLDPLQAYLGSDAKDVERTASFFRSTLNPILTKYNCGCVVAHHTPKTTSQNRSEWRAVDWMYAGAGNADLTNWARSVMIIDPVGDSQEVFRFVAAKRWKRIGWTDPDGNPTHEKFFRHSSSGSIYWEDSDKPEPEAKPKQADISDFMQLIPENGSIPKNILISAAAEIGIGSRKARTWIDSLLYNGSISVATQKRKGVRDELVISRTPLLPSTGELFAGRKSL